MPNKAHYSQFFVCERIRTRDRRRAGREGGSGVEGAIRAGEWVARARVAVKGLDLDAIATATVRQGKAKQQQQQPGKRQNNEVKAIACPVTATSVMHIT